MAGFEVITEAHGLRHFVLVGPGWLEMKRLPLGPVAVDDEYLWKETIILEKPD